MKTWEESKKPHRLTTEFFRTIGQSAFNGGRPTASFFKVWNFFKKLDEETLNLFHEYMAATGKDRTLTMKDLFYKAPEWNQKQRTAVVTETHIDDYLELLKEW